MPHFSAVLKQLVSTFVLMLCVLAPVQLAAQVDANFSASATEGCAPGFMVHFTNLSTNAAYSYRWYRNNELFSSYADTSFEFNTQGSYSIKLVTTNTLTQERDSLSQTITIYSANAQFSITDSSNNCINGILRFQSSGYYPTSLWYFGDGSSLSTYNNYPTHVYQANGSYVVSHVVRNTICSDSVTHTVRISGPQAQILIAPATICKGQEVAISIDSISDILNYSWEVEPGVIRMGNLVHYTYDTTGQQYVQLHLTGSTKECTIQDTLNINEVLANFIIQEARCHQDTFRVTNLSLGNSANFWKLNGSTISFEAQPRLVLNSGTYSLSLRVVHAEGCADSIEQELVVHSLPEIQLSPNATICPGQFTTLSVNGEAINAQWTPSSGLDDPYSLTPRAQPDSNTTYTVSVVSTLSGCSNTDRLQISVQSGFLTGYIAIGLYDSVLVDSSLIVGDSVGVWLVDTLHRNLSYTWSPNYRISCSDCPNPVLFPLESTEYTLEVTDSNQCSASEVFTLLLPVKQEYHLGVAAAFTPNGDQINDLIGVDGWGIQEVQLFQIFNRNGNEVFKGSGNQARWDGTTNAHPQPAGTYLYRVVATLWDNSEKTLQGTFTLIR